MTESMRVERMRESHLDAVLSIEHELFMSPWTHEMFVQELSDNQFASPRVGVIEDCVAGYIVPWFLFDEVHILNLGVSTAFQRRGLARALVSSVLDEARGSGRARVTLEVREGNAPARALYAGFGFRRVATRNGYYEDSGEDAVVMMLHLDGEANGA